MDVFSAIIVVVPLIAPLATYFGIDPFHLAIIFIANLELGGIWRLPSKRELELLVCANCDPPKIDKKSFPSTSKEPYWTGQKNWISPKNFWSINFMTGYSYGRFFPDKELALRLVKVR